MLNKLNRVQFVAASKCTLEKFKTLRSEYSMLAFKETGSAATCIGNESISILAGDILLLPKGYECSLKMNGREQWIFVFFTCSEELGDRMCLFCRCPDCLPLFLSAAELWISGDTSGYFLCQSRLYGILGKMSESTRPEGYLMPPKDILAKSVRYMSEHLYDSEFSVKTMVMLSGVSDCRFRSAFRLRFGKSPMQYILSARMERASELIRSDPTAKIRDIALSVGYSDPLLFSKNFKKKLGRSPAEYGRAFQPLPRMKPKPSDDLPADSTF